MNNFIKKYLQLIIIILLSYTALTMYINNKSIKLCELYFKVVDAETNKIIPDYKFTFPHTSYGVNGNKSDYPRQMVHDYGKEFNIFRCIANKPVKIYINHAGYEQIELDIEIKDFVSRSSSLNGDIKVIKMNKHKSIANHSR